MIKDITKHKIDYSILAVSAGAFLTYFVLNQTHSTNLFRATIVFALFYVVWGAFHHLRTRSLTGKIMLEYILVAAISMAVASTLLL